MNKRRLGALAAATMLTLTFAGTALANDVHQELPIVGTAFKGAIDACGEGWHFVHVGAKAVALPSELTATFKNAGTVKVHGYVNGNSIVMYNVHVDPSDRLLSATDDISDGGLLNLSHVCLAETTTSSTTTTADETTADETTADETTTDETTADETTTDETTADETTTDATPTDGTTTTDATTTTDEQTTTDESSTSSVSADDHGVTGGTTTTSSPSSQETAPTGHVEGLTPPATDTIGQAPSGSTVSTSLLLVLAGVLSFILVGVPAAARKRR
jgi:hypothetical protein